MNKEEAVEMMSRSIPEKDAYIILEIIKKTIEVMNLQPLMPDEEFMALPNEEKYKEYMTKRICAFKFSDDLSCVFFRFVGDETPLASVVFFPIEAVWSFLDTAREYFNTPGTTFTPETIEQLSFDKAVRMFCIMLRNIHSRIEATMQSITEETINEWYRQENEFYREYNSRQGVFVPSNEPQVKKNRQNIIKDYSNEVKNIWDGEKKRFENYQKMKFAEEYEILKKHWETISLLYRAKKDFEGYAKMPGFEDTPDDLLSELKGSHHRGCSLKALEHAARRIGLVNLDNKNEEILNMRKNGIQVSGFSESTLFKYYEEGKDIIKFLKTQQVIENTPPETKQLTE